MLKSVEMLKIFFPHGCLCLVAILLKNIGKSFPIIMINIGSLKEI